MRLFVRPGLYCYDRRAGHLRQVTPVAEREAQDWVRALRAETQRDRELPYYPGQIGREAERVQPDGFLIYPVPRWLTAWRPPERAPFVQEHGEQGVLFHLEDQPVTLSPRSQALVRLRDLLRTAMEQTPPTDDHEYLIICYGVRKDGTDNGSEPIGGNDGVDQTVLVLANGRAGSHSGSARSRVAARRASARSRRVW